MSAKSKRANADAKFESKAITMGIGDVIIEFLYTSCKKRITLNKRIETMRMDDDESLSGY